MLVFRLTERAEQDLRSIGRYTQTMWGREQRNKYLGQLDEAFHLLAQQPQRGQACDNIRLGYNKYRVGQHVVFYRYSDQFLDIIRILHAQMDIESRFDDEA
jgi:toxin ParE1/3/4